MKELKVGIAGFGVVGKRRKDWIERHPNLLGAARVGRTFYGGGAPCGGVRFFQGYRGFMEEELYAFLVRLTNDIAGEETGGGLEGGVYVFFAKAPGRSV